MMAVNISNPAETMNILKKYGFTLKKSLGQNFLIEPNILTKIVEKAEIDLNTGVIEIGPGIGALTQKIAEKAGKVVAIEIDQRLIPILKETLSFYDHIKLIHADVLKTNLNQLIIEELKEYSSKKIVANLPYYVTTPILIKLLEDRLGIDSITVMVQKEVAERINAKPGGKEYGSLTLLIEYYAQASIAFYVPSSVFIPKPNVDSAILHLKMRKEPPIKVKDEDFLFKLIRASFSQRRKTLFNNLIHNLFGKERKAEVEEILNSVGIDPVRRAETLTLSEFAKLSDEIYFREIY